MCVESSDFLFCPTSTRQRLSIVCICVPSFQNIFARTFLWKFGFSQHFTFFVIHHLAHLLTMQKTSGLVLLYHVSKNRQWVISVFVVLSIHCRRLHAFSAWAVYDTNLLKEGAIWTLSLRRCLFRYCPVQQSNHWFLSGWSPPISQSPSATCSCLGDFRIAQLIVELFLFDLFQLVQERNVESRDSKIHTMVTATGLLVLMNCILTVIGFSRFCNMYILLTHVASSAQVLSEVTWVTTTLSIQNAGNCTRSSQIESQSLSLSKL